MSPLPFDLPLGTPAAARVGEIAVRGQILTPEITLTVDGAPTASSALALSLTRLHGAAGTSLAHGGVLLAPGWLPAGAIDTVQVEINGAPVAASVRPHLRPYDDGSLRGIVVQFDASVGDTGAAVLRWGVSDPPRRAESPQAFAANADAWPGMGTLPPVHVTNAPAGLRASGVLGPLVDRETARSLSAQWAARIDRWEAYFDWHWTTGAGAPYNAAVVKSLGWADTVGEATADLLLTIQQYVPGFTALRLWAMGADVRFLRRGLALGHQYLRYMKPGGPGGPDEPWRRPGVQFQQPEAVFAFYALTGAPWAFEALDEGAHWAAGATLFTRYASASGSVDQRGAAKLLDWLTFADLAGSTRRDWRALYHDRHARTFLPAPDGYTYEYQGRRFWAPWSCATGSKPWGRPTSSFMSIIKLMTLWRTGALMGMTPAERTELLEQGSSMLDFFWEHYRALADGGTRQTIHADYAVFDPAFSVPCATSASNGSDIAALYADAWAVFGRARADGPLLAQAQALYDGAYPTASITTSSTSYLIGAKQFGENGIYMPTAAAAAAGVVE